MAADVPSKQAMEIPSSRTDYVFALTITTIGAVFVILAIVNLVHGDALIASSLWLALVTGGYGVACAEAGGPRSLLINCLGEMAGRHFVESHPADSPPREVRFGFQWRGHRFIQRTIPLGLIESVEWSTGQATDLAGRDMNDWTVWVWFDRGDPRRSKKQNFSRMPGQDLYGVGPAGPKPQTEALGLSLVAFLHEAGADLIPDETTSCFIKRRLPEEAPASTMSSNEP